ncbi:hypothetical protein J32TS6_13620 [Virgibacillus pantothenticus]|uniref:TRAP transporter substrate-binding protein n=1 Tax=Virgibacillus pantothenticus TaxID=1473 RepID=UPI001B199CEB|nr:TRAP transporter substrate-binding protein [Virgibacillus pantothenticus]GIP62807.1 hypothetical protein J32TS6_13620 [Virgibacillus pantothenticus]
MIKNKYVMLISTLVLPLLLIACGSDNEESGKGEQTLKIAHYFAESHPQHIALEEEFVPAVEEGTNGRFKVEIYPNSQLGAEEEFTNGVRNGSIQMVIAGMGLQSASPKIGALEWPFLFSNYDEARNALNGDAGTEIKEEFRELNVEPLEWTVNGFRVISSNRAIESIEDFQGLQLRMPDFDMFVRTGEALGVSVQPMPLSEVFTALEQGVIDGQENPYATLKESGFYEVQSHVLESNHMFSPNIYLMNAEFFDAQDEQTQEVIRNAAKKAADYQWELAIESKEKIKQELEAEGMTIIEPSEEFRQAMVEAMNPLYEKLYEEYDWAEELKNTIEASKK